jgi:hypothetical protein
MSAYVVSPTHIDALLSIALHGVTEPPRAAWEKWYPQYVETGVGYVQLDEGVVSEVGAALLMTCIEGVSHRYPDCDVEGSMAGHAEGRHLPGPVPTPEPRQYEFTDLGRAFTLPEALRVISGYEYQACEHERWRETYAYRFCADLRYRLCTVLEGGDTWEITAEKAAERLGSKGKVVL